MYAQFIMALFKVISEPWKKDLTLSLTKRCCALNKQGNTLSEIEVQCEIVFVLE